MTHRLPISGFPLRRGPAATYPELGSHLEVRDLVIVAVLAVMDRATMHLVPLATRRRDIAT